MVETQALTTRFVLGHTLGRGHAPTVHAVEQVVATLHDVGLTDATAGQVDMALWHRGSRPEAKAHKRRRTRTTAY